MITWQLSRDSNGQALTLAYPDGALVTIPGAHARFDRLVTYLRQTPDPDADAVREMTDLGLSTAAALRQLSDRVTYASGTIRYDGEPLDDALSRHLVTLIKAEDPSYGRFVAFLELLATNPSRRSRKHLFSWLTDRELTIAPDGTFIAYKGVRADEQNHSVHSGRAAVDGVEHIGPIPNRVGSVITMPRSSVATDKHIGCSTGLHVGTWEYASRFGDRTLIVAVNPRDVVSVPADHSYAKLRCCRYVVLDLIREPLTTPTYDPADYYAA